MFLSLALTLCSLQVGAPPSPLADREWVIRELVPGRSDFQFADRRWLQAITLLGDMDGDFASEFVIQAYDYPSPLGSGWQAENWRGWVHFGRAGNVRSVVLDEYYPFPQGLVDGSGWGKTRIRSPQGFLVGLSVSGLPLFSTWLPPDFQHPIATASTPGLAFFRFPDLNGDGFDEVLHETRDTITDANVARMLDGATLTMIWKYVDSSAGGVPGGLFQPASVEPWPDLNGDQSPDVLACWPSWLGNYYSAVILALDGATGQLIWRHEAPPRAPGVFSVADCPDITGDGVADVVCGLQGDPQRVIMLDGSTGIPVWTKDISALIAPLTPLAHRYEAFDLTLVPTAVPGHLGEVDILLEVMFDPFWFFLPTQYRFVHLDARTGELRGFVNKPLTQAPWLPDSFDALGGFLERTRIGDWDRDGLVECLTITNGISIDLPNNLFSPRHLVILGMETLRVPAHQSIGTNFEAGVMIPSAPNYDFTLLLSQGFERAGGQLIDGWRTFLAPDSLLFHTRSGLYSGRLDQDGNGSVRVTLPPNPSLSGTTLYSKAVIWKPSSRSEVWTMSSLGVTEIR